MFAKWGSLAYRRRWVVLVATVLLAVLGGVWGLGVFDKLSQGGYEAPSSEAARADKVAEEAFGRKNGDVIVIYRSLTTSAAFPRTTCSRPSDRCRPTTSSRRSSPSR